MAVSLKFKGSFWEEISSGLPSKKISIPRSQDEADLLLAKSISEQSITAHYQKQMEKLVQEYVMMRQLDTCPNIVTCQDLSYVPNGYGWDIYFRMELLHPLKQVIQNSYAETDVIQLGIDICSALIACESVKIIHRDIKPDNIMVSSDGTFKLGDFGIAKTSEKTQTGTMAGTYNYMAPEVANRKRYGLAADVYSLGMVLYWMMNNKTMPFLPLPPQIPSASQKQQALNRRFSGEQLPEPQDGSRELKEIVAKACANAPEDRYHSALEMRNALEALSSKQAWTKAILEELALPEDILHESNRPIAQRAAAEEKPPKSDIPPAKRKPIVPLVVCGILGICILAGGLPWLNRKHASPEPAAMTEALQEQTETAAEPEETTAPGSTTEETLPAATEAESTAAVLLSNVDCTYEIAENAIREDSCRAVAKRNLMTQFKRAGISKAELSRRAGVAASTITAATAGKPLRLASADAISEALGYTRKELFTVQNDPTPLAKKTILEHHRLISTILSQADKELLIPYNPASKATPPRVQRKTPDCYQPDEMNDILNTLERAPIKWKAITYLLIDTGCRRGEIMGLKWNKVNFDTGVIVIDCNLLYSANRGVYEDTTKTGAVRAIKIAPQTLEVLRQWRTEYERLQELNGDRWAGTPYVFVRDDGSWMHPDSITAWLNRFSAQNDLPHIHPHAFRHPYVKHTTKKYFLQKQKSKTTNKW